MDQIQEAISKTKSAPAPTRAPETFDRALPPRAVRDEPQLLSSQPRAWTPPLAELDPRHLERRRVVAVTMSDPSHISFNMLRTKIYKTLTGNGWRRLAITSPTAACGKTMIAANLGFSLARSPNCPTVVIDLDLRRPGLGSTIGVRSRGAIGGYLQGRNDIESCFVRVSDNLTLGLNTEVVRNPSELLNGPRVKDLLRWVDEWLRPSIVLFDLPPMLSADDAMAFLPNVDASLLVAAAGATTAAQIRECERHFAGFEGHLGVVLNKTTERSEQEYY